MTLLTATKVVVKQPQPPPHTKHGAGADGGDHNAYPPTTPNGITLPAFITLHVTIATQFNPDFLPPHTSPTFSLDAIH
jgi:hypothetical protein